MPRTAARPERDAFPGADGIGGVLEASGCLLWKTASEWL